MRRVIHAVMPAVLIAAGIMLFLRRQEPHRTTATEAFNTLCTVTVWGGRDCEAALRILPERLRALHDTLNVYDPSGELSRLNASAATEDVACSPLLWECLTAARNAWKLTDGAFDISVGPLMDLWGFHGRRQSLPDDEEIRRAVECVGLDKVRFDDERRTVRFTRPGMRLDFGGLAKGIACDRAAAFLLENGIDVFLLDFGGNIRLSEKTPRGQRRFSIGIRDPLHRDSVIAVRQLAGVTVSTSGNYERSRIIGGTRVGHIMDPRTGRPGQCFRSVTAVTPSGADADALSTAVFVGGVPLAEKIAAALPKTRFLLIREDGSLLEIGEK